MLGAASTQQVFASAYSIAASANVWVEWNYNSFNPPYVTTSSSASQILDSKFNSTASWVNNNVGPSQTVNTSIAATSSGIGIISIKDSTASALAFTIKNRLSYPSSPTVAPISAGDIYGQVSSSLVNLGGGDQSGRYYKFSFFVKSSGTNYSNTIPPRILSNSITANVLGSGTSAGTYYYRVVGVNSNNQTIGLDLKNSTDAKSCTPYIGGSVTLSWGVKGATTYRIYRSINDPTSATYLTTVSQSPSAPTVSYTDDLSKNTYSAYPPDKMSGNVFVVPTVNLYKADGTTKVDGGMSFIKTTDTASGALSNDVGSIIAKLDGWTRVEVWFGTTSNSSPYSKVSLQLDMLAEYENAVLLVDNIELYEITETDYFLNQYYPTEDSFKSFRPGEILTNSILPSSQKKISNTMIGDVDRPVSFGFKLPTAYFSREKTYPYIQMIPSKFDTFKYYISDNTKKSIQAQYAQSMSINKIVLKHVNAYSDIPSGSIILTSATGTSSVIPLTSSSFNSNGCTILYYNGSTWSATKPSNYPPTLSSSGTFQNVVASVSGIIFTSSATMTTGKIVTRQSTDIGPINNFDRLQIVELSPRLEIDLTPFLISYSVKKEISSGQSAGFPFSYLNANSGQLTLSNIPIYADGTAFAVFENSANNGTFTNLLRQGVKFTGFISPAAFQKDFTENIPQFVMYSNAWSVNDLNDVTVDLYDFSKNVLQSQNSPHFFATQSNLFNIITTMLAAAGISDYDYEGLKSICATSTNTTVFWSDDTKTIFQNLQDLFIVHQIGGYVDEYGMLKFKNLGQIYNDIVSASFTPSAVITDYNYTLGSTNYIPNIIPDSFRENINEKIGSIQIKYQKPTYQSSIDNQGTNAKNSGYRGVTTKTSSQIWQEKESNQLGNVLLSDPMSIGQNYMKIDAANLSNSRFGIGGFKGIGFIGNEIVSYDGLEYVFYSMDNPNLYVNKIVQSQADRDDTISYLLNTTSTSTILYTPTGLVANVRRGRYGTEPQEHPIVTLQSFNSNFNVHLSLDGASTTKLVNIGNHISVKSNKLIMNTPASANTYTMISPTASSNNYNLFAIDFSIPFILGKLGGKYGDHSVTKLYNYKYNVKYKKVHHNVVKKTKRGQQTTKKGDVTETLHYDQYPNMGVGIFFNKKNNNNNNGAYFVEISCQQTYRANAIGYYLNVYYYDNNGKKQNILNSKKISGKYFDGTINRLSCYFQGNALVITINNVRVVTLDKLTIPAFTSNNNLFGAYVHSMANQSTSISIDEIYADYCWHEVDGSQKQIDYSLYQTQARYNFTTTKSLTSIMKGSEFKTSCYLWQAVPRFLGAAVYQDVVYDTKPIYPDTAEVIPQVYGAQQNVTTTNAETNIIGPVMKDDVMYSEIISTPFKFSLMAVNNCDEMVAFYPVDSGGDTSVMPFHINAQYQTLTSPDTINRIINPGYQQSISLGSQWFNSKKDAEKMIEILSKATDTFYVDIDLNIFANPLLQIGDYVYLIYTIKGIGGTAQNIKPITCLVSSISQGWGQGGEDTSIVLKPILS